MGDTLEFTSCSVLLFLFLFRNSRTSFTNMHHVILWLQRPELDGLDTCLEALYVY